LYSSPPPGKSKSHISDSATAKELPENFRQQGGKAYVAKAINHSLLGPMTVFFFNPKRIGLSRDEISNLIVIGKEYRYLHMKRKPNLAITHRKN